MYQLPYAVAFYTWSFWGFTGHPGFFPTSHLEKKKKKRERENQKYHWGLAGSTREFVLLDILLGVPTPLQSGCLLFSVMDMSFGASSYGLRADTASTPARSKGDCAPLGASFPKPLCHKNHQRPCKKYRFPGPILPLGTYHHAAALQDLAAPPTVRGCYVHTYVQVMIWMNLEIVTLN